MKRLTILICAFLWCASAHAAAPVIDNFKLANGMEVIVIENHRVPAVSHMLWFNVGAIDDPPLKSGLAHFHEHMMFQGTANYKKGEYADIVARHGGEQNAFTGHDATAYYVTIAKEYLPLVMQLEADRLRALQPTKEDAEKEREVIIEERRSRTENNPRALFSEQVQAAQFLHHPYRIPVIGWMHEMQTLTTEDVLEFHRRYYHPGNALLIVSGDITSAELKPLLDKYYAPIPAGPKVERHWTSEPPHRAALRLTMRDAQVEQPSWLRSYIAPSFNYGKKELTLPTVVLDQILGTGKTSRLYQALVVKRKLAADISSGYGGVTLGPETFTLSATPAPGITTVALEAAIDEELARIMREDVTPEELTRAKTLLKAQTLYAREGLQSIAYAMGWLRTNGLPIDIFTRWPELIDAVTPAQIKEAANEIFVPRNSVTGLLLPEEKEQKK